MPLGVIDYDLFTTQQHTPNVRIGATHFMDNNLMNLVEYKACFAQRLFIKQIQNNNYRSVLTLLWQSGTSESATVCFVISLSICYWLFKCGVLRIMCRVWECVWVCVFTRVSEGDMVTSKPRLVCKHIRFFTVSVTQLFTSHFVNVHFIVTFHVTTLNKWHFATI